MSSRSNYGNYYDTAYKSISEKKIFLAISDVQRCHEWQECFTGDSSIKLITLKATEISYFLSTRESIVSKIHSESFGLRLGIQKRKKNVKIKCHK